MVERELAKAMDGNDAPVGERNPLLENHPLYLKSAVLDTMKSILSMEENIKQISDMAFDAVDKDGNGNLDLEELGDILKETARDLGLKQPTENENAAVLAVLDQDDDHVVSKPEFEFLIRRVLEKMAKSELEIERQVNGALEQQLLNQDEAGAHEVEDVDGRMNEI